jgi:hypothetical protein
MQRMTLGDILKLVAPVVGQMSLASVRGRASRQQIVDWSQTLRRGAEELERVARGRTEGE